MQKYKISKVFILIFLASCTTALKLIDKAERKDAVLVAKYTREKYPCKDILKSDTAFLYQDTTIYIDCPPPQPTYETIRIDTITNTRTITRTIKMPIKIVTKWYEDSATIKILTTAINTLQVERDELYATKTTLQTKIDKKNKELWLHRSWWILIILYALYKLYKKII